MLSDGFPRSRREDLAPVDLALACFVAYAWITRRHGYTLAYLGFLVLQGGLHVTYVAQPTDGSLMNQYKAIVERDVLRAIRVRGLAGAEGCGGSRYRYSAQPGSRSSSCGSLGMSLDEHAARLDALRTPRKTTKAVFEGLSVLFNGFIGAAASAGFLIGLLSDAIKEEAGVVATMPNTKSIVAIAPIIVPAISLLAMQFVPVPEANKDIVQTIVAGLLGFLSRPALRSIRTRVDGTQIVDACANGWRTTPIDTHVVHAHAAQSACCGDYGDRPSGSFFGDLVEKTIGPTVGSPSGPTAVTSPRLVFRSWLTRRGERWRNPALRARRLACLIWAWR